MPVLHSLQLYATSGAKHASKGEQGALILALPVAAHLSVHEHSAISLMQNCNLYAGTRTGFDASQPKPPGRGAPFEYLRQEWPRMWPTLAVGSSGF